MTGAILVPKSTARFSEQQIRKVRVGIKCRPQYQHRLRSSVDNECEPHMIPYRFRLHLTLATREHPDVMVQSRDWLRVDWVDHGDYAVTRNTRRKCEQWTAQSVSRCATRTDAKSL